MCSSGNKFCGNVQEWSRVETQDIYLIRNEPPGILGTIQETGMSRLSRDVWSAHLYEL
jgi:hypothetical protein